MGAQQSSEPSDEFEVLDIAPKKFENTFICREKSFDVPKKLIEFENPIVKIPNEDISFDAQVSLNDQFDVYHNKFIFNKSFKSKTFLNNYYSDSDDDVPDFKLLNKKKYDRNSYKKFYYRFKDSEFILNDILYHYKLPY